MGGSAGTISDWLTGETAVLMLPPRFFRSGGRENLIELKNFLEAVNRRSDCGLQDRAHTVLESRLRGAAGYKQNIVGLQSNIGRLRCQNLLQRDRLFHWTRRRFPDELGTIQRSGGIGALRHSQRFEHS